MRDTHDRPERFSLPFALVRFVLCISHLFRIVLKNLAVRIGGVASKSINKERLTSSMSSYPSGGAFVLVVLILGMV